VINVSGHRIGTAEVESALVSHPQCAEAAVVGFDHEIKGQGIYAFVTLLEGVEYSQQLRASLVNAVRTHVRGHLWLTAVSKSHLQVGLICKDKEFTSFKSECYGISLCHLPRLQIAGF
jgi:acyl-CoA synthetase (AMP-forming)/AMP-acid ligase II